MDFRPTGHARRSTHAQEPLHRSADRRHRGRCDAGASVAELARRRGIHANTIRLWKSKYNGMDVPDVVRLKELEAENAQMHRIIAKLTLKVDAMDDHIRKNGWGARSAKKQ